MVFEWFWNDWASTKDSVIQNQVIMDDLFSEWR